MRRFDSNTGAEMFVSDYRTKGMYEWYVNNGCDQIGRPIQVASGLSERYEDAIKSAAEYYDQLVESY